MSSFLKILYSCFVIQEIESSIRETITEVRAVIQEKIQSPQASQSPLQSRIELQAQTE